jgi:hypothetical protein
MRHVEKKMKKSTVKDTMAESDSEDEVIEEADGKRMG